MAILCPPASCIKAPDISSYPTLMMSFTEPQGLLAVLIFAATSAHDSICGTSFQCEFFHRHFKQCTHKYGPVFLFRQGLKTIIVVGRFQVAVDIMEKEGAALAERPRSMAAGETLSSGMRVLLTSASERFKKMQRVFVASYSPILMTTTRWNMLDIIQDPERHQDHAKKNIDDETAYLARSMFRASSDTMASKIGMAVMAATCYPDTQKKVQEELDAVIGKDRSPTFADQDILPQTMVFMLESFRWFPHKATRDIIWVCGSFIRSAHKLIIV
ncbi:cytochrome P450 [Armillaria novae-zelandiae]|uniref:Cytochrome P450 n=1 Tax=Armillaria novae-zelandiae TaxID=153914 RepID=A0AA39UA85_9AGAR|nr:cytochrome P450 [Armillaria novae-zelandiae]